MLFSEAIARGALSVEMMERENRLAEAKDAFDLWVRELTAVTAHHEFYNVCFALINEAQAVKKKMKQTPQENGSRWLGILYLMIAMAMQFRNQDKSVSGRANVSVVLYRNAMFRHSGEAFGHAGDKLRGAIVASSADNACWRVKLAVDFALPDANGHREIDDCEDLRIESLIGFLQEAHDNHQAFKAQAAERMTEFTRLIPSKNAIEIALLLCKARFKQLIEQAESAAGPAQSA